MRKGFTLIEVSIVLVIIGFLIAGVLIAQSMIAASKVTAQVVQLEQFDIATVNFKTSFGKTPGDGGINNGWPADGFLRDHYNSPEASNYGNGVQDINPEAATFFPVLTKHNMIKENYEYAGHLRIGIGEEFPEVKLGIGGITVIGGFHGEVFYLLGPKTNIDGNCPNYCESYGIIMGANYDGAQWGSLTSKEALALDSKMDDGKPKTGKVTAIYFLPWGADNADYGTSPLGLSNGNNCVVENENQYLAEPVLNSEMKCTLSILSRLK